jgi:hypothetical protein
MKNIVLLGYRYSWKVGVTESMNYGHTYIIRNHCFAIRNNIIDLVFNSSAQQCHRQSGQMEGAPHGGMGTILEINYCIANRPARTRL